MISEATTLLQTFMLALCVWREARGETPKGRRLVAQTVMNRVKDPRWPNTIVDVITQAWQFSSFNASDPNAVKFPHEGDQAWEDCVAAADEVLLYGERTPLTTANHYHVTGLDPSWRDEKKIVAVEGHHVFYAL